MKQCLILIIFSVLSFSHFQAEGKTDVFPDIKKERGSLAKRIEDTALKQFSLDSNKFVVPSDEQQKNWKQIVQNILNKRFKKAETIIKEQKVPYKIISFTDTSTEREYILLEESPYSKGWGLYAFDLETKSPLVIEIPHPISDENTELQGIEAFLQTRAKAFLLAGTHRRANEKLSICTQTSGDSKYAESDVAHSAATMFHQTHETLIEIQENTTALQLHGMKERDICPNAFISSGTMQVTKNAAKLIECLKNKKIESGVYDGKTSTCPLIASANVQGRFSNGIKKDPCRNYAEASPEPGFFIHLEQEPDLRNSKESWQAVIEAIKCGFPN